MIAAFVLIAAFLCLGLGLWMLRGRAGGNAAAPQLVKPQLAAPPAAAATLDFAPIAAASRVATENLWRRAFGAQAAPDPGEQAMRESIFKVLRADSLDPKYFPRRPTLMTQLMQAFNDERAASEQISRMIAHDPVLTADVLRLANSNLYRTSPEPIGTIQRAVVVCGIDELRRLVATAMLLPVFRATRTNFPRFPRLLWERTERAARAAEMFSAHGHSEDRFEAQMVTLLSALGPLVVYGAALDMHARTPNAAPNPETFTTLLHDLSAPMAQRIAKQWEAAPRLVAALSNDTGESLVLALHVGELLGTLSVLESQTAISNDELVATATGAGIPDAWVYEIAQRLTAKS